MTYAELNADAPSKKKGKSVRRAKKPICIGLRLDSELHLELKAATKRNGASLNSEMVNRLRDSFRRRDYLVTALLFEHPELSRETAEDIYDKVTA